MARWNAGDQLLQCSLHHYVITLIWNPGGKKGFDPESVVVEFGDSASL